MCQRDEGKPREREVRIEGIMTDKERTWLESKITLHGCLESFVDLGLINMYSCMSSTSPVAAGALSDALSASGSPLS